MKLLRNIVITLMLALLVLMIAMAPLSVATHHNELEAIVAHSRNAVIFDQEVVTSEGFRSLPARLCFLYCNCAIT